MFMFHTEEYLRSLERERARAGRHTWILGDLHGRRPARDAGPAQTSAVRPAAPAYAGPERRNVPCPEMKEAMTP